MTSRWSSSWGAANPGAPVGSGLTPRKADVTIAKDYLGADELTLSTES